MVKHLGIWLIDDNKKDQIPESKLAWEYQFSEMKRNLKITKERYIYYTPSSGKAMSLQENYYEFINDILRNIRSGEIDYCFYIYHIKDLLKYEPRLKSRWLEEEQCFKVWI